MVLKRGSVEEAKVGRKVTILAGRGSGRRYTPWSAVGSGCLILLSRTDCAEGIVMVLTQ